MLELNFFDPKQEYFVVARRLPHWAQAGVVCFMTWRTADSLPKDVVERCLKDRDELLRRHGINPRGDWRAALHRLKPAVREQIQWTISERWDQSLDECHGKCLLRRPELSKIVADNLRHLDGQDYELTDFVVMPNHVHVLATFQTAEAMLPRAGAWRRYEAREINKLIGETGHFWQEDGFDHLVRSPEHFDYYRQYIADNPLKARLRPGEYVHYSKSL